MCVLVWYVWRYDCPVCMLVWCSSGWYISLQEMQQQIRHSIEQFPVSDGQGAWQANLHKLVLSYLVHHGYSRTAQVFSNSCGQLLEEDAASIRNRQSEQNFGVREPSDVVRNTPYAIALFQKSSHLY